MPEPIAGQYLVMLQNVRGEGVPVAASNLVHRFGGRVNVLYQNASTGFAATMTDAQATALAHDPMVRFVEEAAVVHLSSDQALPTDHSLYFLDRLDGSQDDHYDYCEKGADVIAYVIGTGTWVDHSEFQTNGSSRVLPGTSFAGDALIKPGDSADYGYYTFNGGGTPCFSSHDLETASVLAGNTFGVAKHASVVPIRISACNGATSSVYLNYAVDWIMGSSNPYRSHRPAVVSISVYQFVTSICNDEIGKVTPTEASYLENEVDALLGYDYVSGTGFVTPHLVHESGLSDYSWYGIPVVVSANNQDSNTGDTTPARMAYSNSANFSSGGHVISVGGLDESDARWTNEFQTEPTACSSISYSGSNYGPTVDIYAAAHLIHLAKMGTSSSTTTSTATSSGTSFSAPIVAGLIARIQEQSGALLPAAAWTALQNASVYPSSAIEPSGGNTKKVARLSGQASCSTEYP